MKLYHQGIGGGGGGNTFKGKNSLQKEQILSYKSRPSLMRGEGENRRFASPESLPKEFNFVEKIDETRQEKLHSQTTRNEEDTLKEIISQTN